ncbi:MAG: alginate export family protein [Verrucomicrobiota bacterium]
MKLKLTPVLSASALVLAAANCVYAQYTPPAPMQPFPGFINDFLRKQDPYYAVWDIGGSVRVRYEGKEGALGLPGNNDFRSTTGTGTRNNNDYFSSKVLANIGYTDKWWSAFVQARSSETWSDSRSATGAGTVPGLGGRGGPEQDGLVDLHQAYVTVGNHKEFPVSAKIGRQELSYGDERLVGAFAWNNIGRVFDAAKVRWQHEWFAAEAFTSKLVLPNDNNPNVWNDYSVFSGLYVTTKQLPKNITELYFFARNENGQDANTGPGTADTGAVLPFQTPAPYERNIYTVGGRIKSNPGDFGAFDYTVEGAYQFGDWRQTFTSAKLDQDAYAFVANAGYTFGESAMQPRFALEYAFGSGDDSPTDGKHGTFDQLYPTGHKHWGYMDIASWQNIHDARAIFTIKPHPRVSVALEGHLFWLADTGDNFYNKGGVARTGGTVGTGTASPPIRTTTASWAAKSIS